MGKKTEGWNRKLVARWFKKRFRRTPRQDKNYFEQWISRFRKGTAWRNMDKESRITWNKIMRIAKKK